MRNINIATAHPTIVKITFIRTDGADINPEMVFIQHVGSASVGNLFNGPGCAVVIRIGHTLTTGIINVADKPTTVEVNYCGRVA